MNISQFSELTGLSAHTLRYYEKIGLLKNIPRNNSGHRIFTDKDIAWLTFILRLKETGMALKHILEYAALREQGSASIKARQALLEAHEQKLQEHINIQQTHLAALQHKIKLYQSNKIT